MKAFIFIGVLMAFANAARAQELIAAPTPDTLKVAVKPQNQQPISDVDIPIRINLRPIYTWANAFVDTLYTSPNYPNDWVQDGCATRYQYRFVRGPFAFKAVNNLLFVSFSGYYGVRGSTRLCTELGNTPWTPACSCGMGTEKPRRIDAGFAIQFQLKPDYTLGVTVNRVSPVPVDKCSVCFFGKDITQTVADQLKSELDASVNAMQKQLQTFSLRPYLQTVWDTLQAPHRMPGFGFMSMQPQQLRISQAELRRDSLFFSLGLSAKPELKAQPEALRRPLPPLADFRARSGFKIFIAQQLAYDSLAALVNDQLGGKDFAVGKGLFKKTVRVDSINLLGGAGKIFVKVYVSKAAKGVFYLEGKPMWDATSQTFWLDSLDYQISTRQLLVRSASALLDGTITNKLKTYTRFNLAEQVKALNSSLLAQMNRSVYPGISSKGYLSRLYVDQLVCSNTSVFIAGGAEGKLWMDVDAAALLPKK
jgi:hypothetical protein